MKLAVTGYTSALMALFLESRWTIGEKSEARLIYSELPNHCSGNSDTTVTSHKSQVSPSGFRMYSADGGGWLQQWRNDVSGAKLGQSVPDHAQTAITSPMYLTERQAGGGIRGNATPFPD